MRIRTTPAGSFLALTGGNLTGALDMGSQRITSLAAGTVAGDAVRYEQALLEALLITRGDILFRGALVAERLAKGTAGQFLTQGALDPAWGALDVGEGHILILPLHYVSIGQGTWVLVLATNYYLFSQLQNSSNANLDNISYKVYLAVGTYTLQVVGATQALGGITDIDIDAAEVASLDWYSASTVYNVVKTTINIAIATAGLKTLKVRLDGKNASATGYAIGSNSITLWRTA